MTNFTDASATKALNEDQYINKLYDTGLKTNKDTLSGYYKDNTGFLDAEQKRAQGQTADYVARTNVEADKAARGFQEVPKWKPDMGGQEALTRWNQRQADVTALQTQQSAADAEIQRQRDLLAQEYQRAIQQAQADNDMQRAQALYDAAKAEEDQLLALRKEAGVLMSQRGDRSILEEMKGGVLPQPNTTSESWQEALKNEEAINKIYDAQRESQRLEQEEAFARQLSDLYAQRDKTQRATDQQLTQAYVDAQKRMQSQNENQNAHGMASGTQEQARLAREMGLQADMTKLRTLQTDAAAAAGVKGLDLARAYRDAAAKQQAQTEQARVKALYDAAEKEEQSLIDTQKFLGDQYAQKNDYSILGKLYGLTPEQIKKLASGGGGGGGYSSSGYSGGGGKKRSNDAGGSEATASNNRTVIPLGYGPVDDNGLQELVRSGNVNVSTNSSGGKSYSNAPKTNAGISMQMANAGKPVYTASSSKPKSNNFATHLMNAVKNLFK